MQTGYKIGTTWRLQSDSLRRVFSLCARFDWCDVCIDFTNVIKKDVYVDVNEMSLLNN